MQVKTDHDHHPFILGYSVASDGTVQPLDWVELRQKKISDASERTWVHLNRLSSEARAWLDQDSDIDPLVTGALFQEDTRPRATRIGQGLLMNFRGANHNTGAEAEDLISIRVWMTDKIVITTRAYSIRAVDDLKDKIDAGDPPETNGDLVCFLVERLTTRLEPVVASLEEKADELEAEWLDLSTPAPKLKLSDFRRTALSLRRYITPQREAISSLIREGNDLFSDGAKIKFREIQDVTIRLSEDLDLARERAVVIQEQIVEQRGEAMNQRLFVLAIVSAVFLPLGFLTGLFGINIGGMPGVDNAYAFSIFLVFLIAVTAGLFGLFKWLKWM